LGPFLVPAILIGVCSIPLIFGVVPRNSGYGVRTRKTLADDRTWYAANTFGGWVLLAASLAYLVTAAVVPYASPNAVSVVWLVHLAVFAGSLLVSLLLIFWYVKRL
jgi:uncharacterized membrane protein